MSMVQAWMTTAEAAEELEVSRAMVHKLLNNGSLFVAGRTGRSVLIDAASIQRYKNRRSLNDVARTWRQLGQRSVPSKTAPRSGLMRRPVIDSKSGSKTWSQTHFRPLWEPKTA